MDVSNVLHNQILAVCPNEGISIPDISDKSTWIIWYDPSATDAQKQAAQVVVQGFDPSAPANNPTFVLSSVILGRLTEDEYTGIMQAAAAALAQGNGQLSRWFDMARTAPVDINSPVTAQVMQFMVANNLLTQDRAAVIFAGG